MHGRADDIVIDQPRLCFNEAEYMYSPPRYNTLNAFKKVFEIVLPEMSIRNFFIEYRGHIKYNVCITIILMDYINK